MSQVVDEKKQEEEELPIPWQRIQGAIWVIGLAILFWRGWIWPGILLLVGISALFQGVVMLYLSRQKEQQSLQQRREDWLPSKCPNCGAPLSVATVQWTGTSTADCPYCHANLKPEARDQSSEV